MRRRALAAVIVAALVSAAVAAAADSTDPKVEDHEGRPGLRVRLDAPVHRPRARLGRRRGEAGSLKIPVCPSNQPNNSDLTITGHAESSLTLDSAAIQVDTDVLVFKNAGQVSKLVKRTSSTRPSSDCLRYDLIKSVGGQGVTVVGVSQLPVAKAGDHSALYRVTLAVKVGVEVRAGLQRLPLRVAGARAVLREHRRPGLAQARAAGLENGIAKKLAARRRDKRGTRPRPQGRILCCRQAPPGAGFVE